MKKISILILVFIACTQLSNAQYQVFGAANSIEKNQFVIGVNPFTMVFNGDNLENHKYFASNIYAAKGIGDIFDARLRLGIFSDFYDNAPANYSPLSLYGGLEFEALIHKAASHKGSGYGIAIMGGMHAWGNKTGVDGSINFSYRVFPGLYLYSGFDVDANYEEISRINNVITKDFIFHYWVPVGVQFKSSDLVEFIFEIGVPVTSTDNYIIGGGFNYYIKFKK